MESEAGRFTLVYLFAPLDAGQALAAEAPLLELTYNGMRKCILVDEILVIWRLKSKIFMTYAKN